MDFSNVVKSLEKRGFTTKVCASAEEAKQYLTGALENAPTVAFGGSITLKDMGMADTLRAAGHEVLWHWDVPLEQREAVIQRAWIADAYVCSANALLADGRIMQIDGTGNRVAALCAGPKRAYLVIGRNKLVSGSGMLAGVARIKRDACAPNARRLGLQTPCAKTGSCDEETCRHMMCHVTLVMDCPTSGHQIEVVLVDEDLGY